MSMLTERQLLLNEKGESGAIVAVLGKEYLYHQPIIHRPFAGAAGAVEAIVTIEAMRHNFVPMTAGTSEVSDLYRSQCRLWTRLWSKKFHTLFQIPLVLVATMRFLLSNVGRINKYEFKRY